MQSALFLVNASIALANQACAEAAPVSVRHPRDLSHYRATPAVRMPQMCGIAGFVGAARPGLLDAMCAKLAHRGPDDSGTWSDPAMGVSLGHRRLSIIDLTSAGHQPMANDDGSVILSYNGEIYDFEAHRDALIKDGVRFRSRTDSEVLLRLYERYGVEMLDRVNGMFAFAIWDAKQAQLLLARDHAGIKPLYYWIDGTSIYFASEMKALLMVPGLVREPNLEMIRAYLAFLWVPGDQTMLRGVRKLEPGHYLLWRNGRVEVRRWFSLEYEQESGRSDQDWIADVRETFVRATRRQMVADVPLGAFLSGGLDSSAIVASMRQAFPDRQITAYTAEFGQGEIAAEQGVDDLPFAQAVARHLRLDLKQVRIKPDVISLLPQMVYHLDEPDADPAVFPSYLISNAAREDGSTVLLSGTGGDEVFFGYRSHQAYSRYAAMGQISGPVLAGAIAAFSPAARLALGGQHRLVRRLAKFARGLQAVPGVARHMAVVDWSDPLARAELLGQSTAAGASSESDLLALLEPYDRSFRGSGELNRHSHLLINTFLAAHNFLYTDKSSMAASIEVRVPFLDRELMQLAARMPERLKLAGVETKYVLKRAMEDWLPRKVIYRSKSGFGVPLRNWLRSDLAGVVNELLGADAVRRRGLFEPALVQHMIDQNARGTYDHAYAIYALLVLEVWMRTFIDSPGTPVDL
jgi:asparagine synthase (glutamine-hydrolysing)